VPVRLLAPWPLSPLGPTYLKHRRCRSSRGVRPPLAYQAAAATFGCDGRRLVAFGSTISARKRPV
jgi:hypothetical protein